MARKVRLLESDVRDVTRGSVRDAMWLPSQP